jgi:hypothetical protein
MGCPPPAPLPPSPDASDASAGLPDALPAPSEASPPPPPGPASADCVAACQAMTTAGCVVQSDCAPTLTIAVSSRLIRNARTGNALTCADLAVAKTAADVQALGQACGPAPAPPSSSRTPPRKP